jgi:hypothetical protein
MRPKSPPGTVSVAHALQESPTLGSLLGRWRLAQECMQAARSVLGPVLSAQMRPGPVEDKQWTLLAATGAAAAKSRQLLPRIDEAVRGLGLGVESVRIRISPLQPEPVAGPNPVAPVVPTIRIERMTSRLQGGCSTS